jgi:uncharacterized protein
MLLFCAGLLGGAANAMAGGASLITFPAMMAAGLAPIPANASNALAVVMGNVTGFWAERRRLSGMMWGLLPTCLAAGCGGAAGAVFLLVTPEQVFTLIVPVLIGAATVIFGFSKAIQSWVAIRFGSNSERFRVALVVPTAVYGGYFGAGMGVIFMAVLSATTAWDLRTANAAKNLFAVIANFAAIAIFISQGLIAWPETIVMMAGCVAGGNVGAKLLGVVPAPAMRAGIVVIGVVMTAFYVWKYWI